ncbi:MAG: hypothetical protein N3B13_05150, partial [Deltaproteobacteria bacterium]|nr:hypothetical protein [Deltaproteobacteria bacterium]
ISKFRKGISVTNDSGKPEGFLLTGTLQNGERIDIFALRIDLKGNVIFAKSYSRQLPNVNKFDVYAVMYIRSENTFVIVGESSGTPLFLAIKEDGNSPLAKYYIEDSGGSFNNAIGFFTDIEILPTYDDSLYITGVYLGIGGRKAVSAVNLKYSGDVKNFYRISSQIDLTGFAMTPSIGIVSSEQFFIFGEAGIRGIALNALAMKYDFASKKLENAFIISGKDLSSNQVGLSFRNVRTINKNGPVNLVGGSYLFLKNASVVSNALVALIEQNLSVSKMKAVKNTDVEEVIDMIFSDSFVFISPTTFNNNLDILAVKMNSDLEIKGASCNKSFLSDVSFTGQSLVNPSVESVSVKVFEIGDLKVQEVLNNQMEATGSASNVCNKP